MRYFILLIAIFFNFSSSFAQNSLPVRFPNNPSRNTQIGMFVRGSTIYGSLNDLAEIFGLKRFYNGKTQKLEIRSDQSVIRVAANNFFVVIVDQKQNSSIVQLPRQVIFAANTFFVPMNSFAALLDQIIPERFSFYNAVPEIIIESKVMPGKFDITDLSFEEKSNGFLVRIHCSKKLNNYESWLKPIKHDTWLYVTIADAKADVGMLNNIKASGLVQNVLAFQSPASIQLTFKIKGPINSAELIPAEGSDDILLAVHTPTEEQLFMRSTRSRENSLELERNRWKLDVIVIDAGHGGEDPGAIGLRKTREKDVTLAIALKLGRLIEEKIPEVKVVYTRKTDKFVELDRRGQIANQNGGKLFISIHCNSARRKAASMRGFEIYLLRHGKTDEALQIAERENEVVRLEKNYQQRYKKLTEENFILLTMAQSAYVKYSEQFADILQQEMGKHLKIENNGVKQAGFYVLVGASMPNVLVETGYLSNGHDEKILRSSKGQQKIAEAVFNGVLRYKQAYENSLDEGKEIGSIKR